MFPPGMLAGQVAHVRGIQDVVALDRVRRQRHARKTRKGDPVRGHINEGEFGEKIPAGAGGKAVLKDDEVGARAIGDRRGEDHGDLSPIPQRDHIQIIAVSRAEGVLRKAEGRVAQAWVVDVHGSPHQVEVAVSPSRNTRIRVCNPRLVVGTGRQYRRQEKKCGHPSQMRNDSTPFFAHHLLFLLPLFYS